jgi:hypothetical protein
MQRKQNQLIAVEYHSAERKSNPRHGAENAHSLIDAKRGDRILVQQ